MSFLEKMLGRNEQENGPVDVVKIEQRVARKFGPRLSELGPNGVKSLELFLMGFILLATAVKGAENNTDGGGKFIPETPQQIALNKMVPLKPVDWATELYGERQVINMGFRYMNTEEDYARLRAENKAGRVRSAITGDLGGHIGGDEEAEEEGGKEEQK